MTATLTDTRNAVRLTEEQETIIRATDRHIMVEAGAGSGKTTLLIEKLLFELGEGGIADLPPKILTLDQIGAITFTVKAAGEIKERLRQEFLRRAASTEGTTREAWAERAFRIDQAMIGTIDAFAGRLIREYGALAGIEAGFEVLEAGDAAALHQEVAEAQILDAIERGDPGARFLVRQFGFLRARNFLASLFERADVLEDLAAKAERGELSWSRFRFAPNASDLILEEHAFAVLAFARTARRALFDRMCADGVLDHTHVIMRAAELALNPDVQKAFRERLNLLFVDEHQDTNLSQVRLLFRLAGIPEPGAPRPDTPVSPPSLRLILVGDPKQGIYGFRNADITMWRESRRSIEAAGGTYHTLTQNHRSRPSLLRFFDATLGPILGTEEEAKKNLYEIPYRALVPARPETEGPAVEFLLADESGTQNVAEIIAERVATMLARPEEYPVYEKAPDGTEIARPLRARDIAILSRNLAGSADAYERALRERGVKSYVYGGRGLYSRQEIQDIAIMLRAIADPHDPFALTAFLRSPIGGVDDHTLADLARAVTTARSERDGPTSLYDALLEVERFVPDADRARRARAAADFLETLRAMRDRLPHDRLIERALEESGYRAFLAGAPDAPAGLRNVDKLLRIARRSAREPLFKFVDRLAARVRRADREEEAPLYSPDDDLVVISTIHKAKGLEWPYVIVAGIDEGLFKRIGEDAPRLCPHFGIALPLDLVIRDETSDVPATADSVAWQKHFETETKREYAEAKRLFYVACTRARDRLMLAGALTRPWREKALDGPIQYRYKDGYERWLRHLYPALTQSDNRGAAFTYGPGRILPSSEKVPDVAEIRRGVSAMRDANPTSGEVTAPVGDRSWPKPPACALPTPKIPHELESEIARRTGSLDHHSMLKEDFSASELLKFAMCAWKHYYGYRLGISAPTIEAKTGDAIVNQILPEKRGDILHDFLSEYDESWSAEREREEMLRVLLKHLPMDPEDAERNIGELLDHAHRYLASEWAPRVRAAERAGLPVYRECPFLFEFAPGIRFRGDMDLVWKDSDGWRILDFKTGLIRGLEHVAEKVVAERAKSYRIQASIYTLALRAALGSEPVREFVFFFTAPGLSQRIAVDDQWPEVDREEILDLVRRIRAGDYGDEPVWEKKKCDGCEYLRLCRPRGAPEDELVRITIRDRRDDVSMASESADRDELIA